MRKDAASVSQTRGRPRLSESQKADMRLHISQKALQLFQEHGYAAVSMRRLAKESGCTVVTLYRYFDRKIDVLRALWAQVFEDLFDELEVIAKARVKPRKRLERVAQAYVAFWLKHREHYFMVFMSSDVSQTDVSVFVEDESVVARFRLFYALLEAALPEKVDEETLEAKGQLLVCSLNGICHNLITINAYNWISAEELSCAAVAGVLVGDR